MKELSIEQKAQRYDEALKAVIVAHKDEDRHLKATLERIFPELKESEDERIRKELITHCRSIRCVTEEGAEGVAKWIDWLEKQGEQKSTWSEEDEEMYKKVETAIDSYYAPFSRDAEEMSEWFKSLKDRVQLQPKQEWSEEDDKILKSIIINIENLQFSEDMQEKYHHIPNENKSYYQIKIDWLKSLKDRVQPKQEWSGGDEAHLHSLITHLEQWIERHPNTTGADIQGENIAWLKSLRPQNNITDEELAQAKKDAYNDALDKIEYHSGEPTFDDGWSAAIDYIRKKSLKSQNTWKPSEEQMISLERASSSLVSTEDTVILRKLLNDLEKLRKE